jgi:hypothetical protein
MLDVLGNGTGRKKIIWYVRSEIFHLIFLGENVTNQGSVFKSRIKRIEGDKLSWSFGWLNYESRNMGYVAEQHSHTRQALVWDKDTVQF